MENMTYFMPAVALRGMTILPGMIAHFDISRERSLKAIEEAMSKDRKVFLVTQKDIEKEEPLQQDLYEVGIVAEVKQVVRLQNDIVRILVDGIDRANLFGFSDREEFLEAEIATIESDAEELPSDMKEAMLAGIKESFEKYAKITAKTGKELLRQVSRITDIEKLIDYVTNNLPVSCHEKQKVLNAVKICERYEILVALLLQQIEITAIKNDFQKKV